MSEITWYKKKAELPNGYKYVLARDYDNSKIAAKAYAVFPEYSKLIQYLECNQGGHLNEVIISEKVYLYFDIDMKIDAKLETVIGIFLVALRGFLKQICDIDMFWVIGSNCQVAESVRPGKCSFHFVTHEIVVDSVLIHKKLTLAFIDFIIENNLVDLLYHNPNNKCVECAIDASIYGSFRCFRCLHMSKSGVGVVLRPYKESSQKICDHLINCYEDSNSKIHIKQQHVKYGREVAQKTIVKKISVESNEEADVSTEQLNKVKELIENNDDIKELLNVCGKVKISYTYSLRDNKYSFFVAKACRPICPFAGRMHSDNHLCVCYNAIQNNMYLKCMSPKCLEKYHSMRYMLCPSASVRDKVHDRANLDSLHTQQEAIPWAQRYTSETMHSYPNKEFVCIRGGMGVGKTKTLKEFAQQNFGARTKVVIVTFSRNLAAKYATDFNSMGFVNYQDVKSTIINDGKVIVCLDSLWRVVMRNPDYIIIDEALSVFLHFNSPLMQRSSENTTLLELLICQAKHCYMLDACIDNTFMKNVVDYLAAQKKVSVDWIWNEYIRPTNRYAELQYLKLGTYKSISKKIVQSKAVQATIELIESGKKVVVCSSTKKFTNILGDLLQQRFPDLRVLVINSDTSGTSDEVIDTNKWKECDVLVYSPSITAGVSFEELHFDGLVCFLANTNFTPTIDVTLQQLFRVRKLREGKMLMYVYDEPGNDSLPLDDSSIEFVLNNDNAILREYYKNVNFYSQQRIENGALVYDTDRLSYQILKGIIMVKNRSRVFYLDTLKKTLEEDYGIPCILQEIAYKPDVDTAVMSEIDDATNKINVDIPFSDDLIISEDEFYLLCDKLHLTDTERMQKRLYEMQHFMWKMDCVDEEFYKNLVACKSAYEKYYKAQRFSKLMKYSESEMQAQFTAKMEAIKNSLDPNIELFKSKYAEYYRKLICGLKLLKALFDNEEWKNILVQKLKIHENDLIKRCNNYLNGFSKTELKELHNTFGTAKLKELMIVRDILDDTFGISINRGNLSTKREQYRDIVLTYSKLPLLQDDK